MLIVFAIIGTLTVTGVTSFFAYSQNQSFQTSVADVSHVLSDLKTRAISQVKPSQCGIKPLKYYQLSITAPGSTYVIKAMCDTTLTQLGLPINLPSGVTFTDTSPITINFFASTGVPTKAQVVNIAGFGKTSKINVDSTGIISVQ